MKVPPCRYRLGTYLGNIGININPDGWQGFGHVLLYSEYGMQRGEDVPLLHPIGEFNSNAWSNKLTGGEATCHLACTRVQYIDTIWLGTSLAKHMRPIGQVPAKCGFKRLYGGHSGCLKCHFQGQGNAADPRSSDEERERGPHEGLINTLYELIKALRAPSELSTLTLTWPNALARCACK